ncbi:MULTISPECIES: ZIP family metal transporter [unclassified Halanaerobium]|uniref:ZIP family metal transporter n=1 Tax=unclassified Halanaerobium TaxID=2641197 RepID=UPI000DF2D52B|nr:MULTISPECIES: ZIP family metal transporter [unclassified Halanaerobium]RCW51569.1 ZIP family zinc transporter [Halanaerobium sp. MA284_MarDTE_T2]RCW89357.1 ZIP family zinc transporter [Halanaerobium sp. DL-01]
MIIDFLIDLSPLMQALLATLFTWFVTALGAAVVFFFKNVNRRLLDSMLGFAAGIMIAASFWSLLAPAIEISESQGVAGWIPAVIGFLMGGIFLRLVDMVLPHLHPALAKSEPEGIKTNWQRSVLLVLAVTLHNFPEGLAVGVAFGAAAAGIPSATIAGAVVLAGGIGLQNFPEGAAVSIPLKREGLSAKKSFMYGQLSGAVEPIAGILGAAAVYYIRPILPYALAFAAGAMIFVVGEELIPEANSEGNSDLATTGLMLGFAVMMFLDISLG